MSEVVPFTPATQAALFNIEAEQQLLGAILINNEVYLRVADMLLPEHFFDPVHADIYKTCGARITRSHLASPVTLKAVMAGHEGLAQLGGPSYLVRIAGASISAIAAPEYARVILDLAARRALTQAAQDAAQAVSGGADTLEVSTRLQHALSRLPEASGEASSISLMRAMAQASEQASEAYQGNREFLKTGIPALDGIIKGLGPGDYMLLGGASSMGKTSVLVEIATQVASAGKGVVFVSLEMSAEQLATRIASAHSRIPYVELRDAATMDEARFRKWIESSVAVSPLPIRIVPKHVRDVAAVHAACVRARADLGGAGLGLVVVDYAQLVRGQGKSRFEQMTDVSIGLKTLAGLLGVPLVAGVQIDRNIGERDDKRPQMTDIRESGQFENDADQVVFCFREEYYLTRRGPKPDKSGAITIDAQMEWDAEMKRAKNVMDLIVRKNRHGGLGTVKVGFHEATNRFWTLEHQEVFD